MKIKMCHPTANQNVRAVAMGLANAGLLDSFVTSVAIFPGSWLDRLGRSRAGADLRRRTFHPGLKPFVQNWPWRELGRVGAMKMGWPSLYAKENSPLSIDKVYGSIDRHVASQLKRSDGQDLLYLYEDGAYYSFTRGKALGYTCLYDLPIGYWRKAKAILSKELEKNPEWAKTIGLFHASEEKLARKDVEIGLADHIFVASSFTAKSLDLYPGIKPPVTVLPYGFPPPFLSRQFVPGKANLKLKVLYVGSLSQRKGISYLFDAVANLQQHVELTIVGNKVVDDCQPLNTCLNQHRWIPSLPHEAILQLMREHDVLVFPSLLEGFGLVITEAMSQGMPVITTPHTAGPDLITNGKDGWIVPPSSSMAIQEMLELLLQDRQLIAEAGYNAMQKAAGRPWDVYGLDLAAYIQDNFAYKAKKVSRAYEFSFG